MRQAQRRDVEDRRRAAGLLARSLPAEGTRLSGAASRLAWSKPQPTPDGLEELAQTVESELKEQV